MNLVKYVVRENNGRFSNYRKIAKKIIFKQLIIISVLMNIFLVRQIYNFHCSAGGYFVKKDQCDQMAQNKFDSQQLVATQNQLTEMQGNLDLYK